MKAVKTEKAIRSIVNASVMSFAKGFEARHIGEKDNPNGVINMKIHNVFIAVLGKEIQYYTALVRSFDSSLGNMLEQMAINIAKLFYEVNNVVEGFLFTKQTSKIAEILEAYADINNPKRPSIEDYRLIRDVNGKKKSHKRHFSDYYLIDKKRNKHFLIELKIGGDLDNKKARAEKEALLEQYAILSNVMGKESDIKCYFATAYNRFGEGNDWKQTRVLQFFAKDELLIGKDFWNFICKNNNGYNIIIDEYKKASIYIKKSLEQIREEYLGG